MMIQGLTSTPPSTGGSQGRALTIFPAGPVSAANASGTYSDNAIPPATTAVATRNSLRSISVAICSSSAFGHQSCRLADSIADFRIGAAATDIGHLPVDIGIAGMGIALEERGRRHDLAGLAIAALRHLLFDPGHDNGMVLVRGDAFDGGDVPSRQSARRKRAGPHGLAIDVHRASTAKARAAAEFGAGQAKRIAQDPKKGSIGLGIHIDGLAVDLQRKHRRSPPYPGDARWELHHDIWRFTIAERAFLGSQKQTS